MSVITLKLKYECDKNDRILELIKNYNSIFGITYNFMFDHQDIKNPAKILKYINTKNNLKLNTRFRLSSIYDAKNEITKHPNKKIIFGGKELFLKRQNNQISKEDYRVERLRPLCMVGCACRNGNDKFQIISKNEILFKVSRNEHITLHLKHIGRNYEKKLEKLIVAQEENKLPITYLLSKDYVYLIIENNKIEELKSTSKIKDRIFSIDMNPNYVGWVVVDWKENHNYKIIDKGVISLKPLNDYDNSLKGLGYDSESKERKYITNKRKYEVIEIAHKLCKIANHYGCQLFTMEDLNIKTEDKEKGRNFNKLCNNQWCRNKLENIITKMCDLYHIKLQKVVAAYSSFEGNLIYRQERLPDMCLSAIEISRRGYEFYHQWVLKDKEQVKNIIFDNSVYALNRIKQSLEELNYSGEFAGLSELYYSLKKARCNYRFSIEESKNWFGNSFSSKELIHTYVSILRFV